MARSSVSLNSAPSAVLCTSTKLPVPVMTKLASVSAVEFLGIIEIENRGPLGDATGDGGDVIADRTMLDDAALAHPGETIVEGDEAAGDRRGSRAAVGLDDVAIDGDLPLAERGEIDDGA